MLCFSEIASSFTLWGRAALPLPSGDADGTPPPAPQDPWVLDGKSLGIDRTTLGLNLLLIFSRQHLIPLLQHSGLVEVPTPGRAGVGSEIRGSSRSFLRPRALLALPGIKSQDQRPPEGSPALLEASPLFAGWVLQN